MFALEPVAAGAKVYIHQQGGFGTYLAGAFRLKGVPLTVVANRSIADYEVIGNSESQKAGWAKILITRQTGSREETSMNVIDLRTSEVVFAYNYNTDNAFRGKQSAAESCAKHLANHILKGGRLASSLPPLPPPPPPPPPPVAIPQSLSPLAAATGAIQPISNISARFTSTPAEADLIVDGQFWGITPTADLSKLSEGSHIVVVKKFGYDRWERTIILSQGHPITIHADLQREIQMPSKAKIFGLE